MSTPIASVDELCVGVENALRAHLVGVMDDLGFTDPIYDVVKTWQQLPTTTALVAASLPGVAVSAAGLVDAPVYSRSSGTWTTTWRIAVGIYERGKNHADTQARVRNWCAGIRTTLVLHKSLGGLASALSWSGEEYALVPDREQARTIAAAAVAFDVTATISATVGNLPPVTSTPTSVSVK
jgi:hypothetical protein